MKKILKNIFIFILLALLIIPSYSASPLQKVFAESITDNSVIILSGSVLDNNTLTINAKLTVNTGINGMTLELIYDTDAMTLSNIVMGEALASLEPITTNTKTEKGFSITPFKINYFGNSNDFTKGNMFTMTFDINENVTDGNYKVSLKYSKDADVTYYDDNNEMQTKNLYIDNTEIAIKNNSVVKISSIKDSQRVSGTFLKIVIICSSVVVIGSLIAFVIRFKRRRNWKRL
jgi:hypothetical protein